MVPIAQNNGLPAKPLFNLPKFGANGWWFHGDNVRVSPPTTVLSLIAVDLE